MHRIIAWDNVREVAAYVIGLLEAEEVRLLAFALCVGSCDRTPGNCRQVWPYDLVEGESFHPIVLREVRLKIPEVLGHRVLSTIFPHS